MERNQETKSALRKRIEASPVKKWAKCGALALAVVGATALFYGIDKKRDPKFYEEWDFRKNGTHETSPSNPIQLIYAGINNVLYMYRAVQVEREVAQHNLNPLNEKEKQEYRAWRQGYLAKIEKEKANKH